MNETASLEDWLYHRYRRVEIDAARANTERRELPRRRRRTGHVGFVRASRRSARAVWRDVVALLELAR